MAVIKEVKAPVASGGEQLREYDAPADEVPDDGHNDAKSRSDWVVKYIEATANTSFEIKLKVRKHFVFENADFVSFCTWLDGKYVGGWACVKPESQETTSIRRTYQGPHFEEDGQWQIQTFRWNDLPTVDEYCTDEQKKKYAKVGTIRIVVSRERGATVESVRNSLDVGVDEPVPEKAVKGAAVDLFASLSGPQPCIECRSWDGVTIDKEPYARFIFKYRSKEALQALGILKRPGDPVPLEKREIDSLSNEQLKELAHRNKAALEAQKVKIKKENAEANLSQLADLKRGREDGDDDDDDEVEFLSQQAVKKVCIVDGVIE